MERNGGHQESRQATASSNDQIEAKKVVDGSIRAPRLVVCGVQPVQTEYAGTRTGQRRQVAWRRKDGGRW